MVNWGLSLVFSGLLARAIARRSDLRADYRALGAAAYLGLGAVWALGLSSSAAQLQATPESLPPELLEITGVLDFGATILTWQSLLMAAVLIALSVAVAWASAPQGEAIRTAEDMDVDLSDRVEPLAPRARPGEWLEYSRILPVLIGLLTLGWVVNQFVDAAVPVRDQQPQRLPHGLPDPRPGAARHPARLPQRRDQGRADHGRRARPVPAVRRDGGHPDPGRRVAAGSPSPSTWPTCSPASATAAPSPS